jgi:hypothetical protein
MRRWVNRLGNLVVHWVAEKIRSCVLVMSEQPLGTATHTAPEEKPRTQPRAQRGRFASPYNERRGAAIALRLPQSIDQSLRKIVGWRSKADNPTLKAWVEAAIREKLERHQRENR